MNGHQDIINEINKLIDEEIPTLQYKDAELSSTGLLY